MCISFNCTLYWILILTLYGDRWRIPDTLMILHTFYRLPNVKYFFKIRIPCRITDFILILTEGGLDIVIVILKAPRWFHNSTTENLKEIKTVCSKISALPCSLKHYSPEPRYRTTLNVYYWKYVQAMYIPHTHSMENYSAFKKMLSCYS